MTKKIEAKDPNARFLIRRFETGESVVSFYILSPGETFAGFGGSSGGLSVRKTASLITRHETSHGTIDDGEYDVTSTLAWEWFERLMRREVLANVGK